ncbi:TRAP transporter small permease subunit [Yoonia sp.]|uniref:TRAP transporter small permease n=1 Tax=Yoonia sp. TaxID=2212373 RepID=UPI0025FC7A72|nr:TRAP transporter small permease subunit [Yoonia sp.]
MSDVTTMRRTGWSSAAAQLITAWAILGGFVLLLVVAMNVASVIGGIVWKPFPGDFEMTQVGVAVAVFAFLPYCQINDTNVTADIFTQRAPARTVLWLKLITAMIALGFAVLLLWRMFGGLQNQRDYGYTTTILQFPIWTAFVPILVSLALLALAALVSLSDNAQALKEIP